MTHLRFFLPTTAMVLLMGTLLTPTAQAWGRVGHAVIALRAERELTPQARAQLKPMLELLGVNSISEIASWSDERRNRASAKWHFTNMGASCVYSRARDCPDGQCLVEIVKQRAATLADTHNPLAVRANSLIDLVHFAGGDSSQPLHSGYASDKGANTFQIRVDDGYHSHNTNLHTFWDSGEIKEVTHSRSDEDAIVRMGAELDRVAPVHRGHPSMDPAAWIGESCQVVHEAGFYPASHIIDAHYVEQARPVLDAQLIQGADELAGVLNQALIGHDPMPMGH